SAQNPSGSDCPATAPWDPQLPMILGDTADATYEIRLTLEGMLPAKPTVTVALPLTEQELASARSQVTYTYDPQSMRAIHRETGGASYTDDWEFAAAPDGWIFDEENLQRYLAGEDATALAALTADGTAHRVPLPGTSPYFATLSNDNSWGSTLYLSLAVSVEPYTPEETTDITPGGSGCSCTVSGAVPRPGPLWIFGLLALWLYRKRILTST
ncbi:hypothetical protein KKF84_12970, partial [Myxococcota bacterium]|nr:hypothetical protein [Myxococcota bacterium]